MKINNFKELNVWKHSVDLATETYRLSNSFPDAEKFGLKSQVQRAAVSIPSNIAEGCGRTSGPDFQRFISISMGSSFELETQMIIANKLNYISAEELKSFEEGITPIQKMLNKLYDSISR